MLAHFGCSAHGRRGTPSHLHSLFELVAQQAVELLRVVLRERVLLVPAKRADKVVCAERRHARGVSARRARAGS
jgi:hypothetical protein